jgi:penicillin amidase
MYFTFERVLEASLRDPIMTIGAMGAGFHPLLRELHEFSYSVPLILFRMLDAADSAWFTRAGGKQATIEGGLKKAVQYLAAKLGKDPKGWEWGRINKITFPHAFATQKPMDAVFNPPLRPMGGTATTVCVSWSPPGLRWQDKNTASSFRFAIDWADPSRAGCIVPPGQSGHLASPHYADMYEPWLKGEYIPMLWTREQVQANAEATLALSP